jgi:hypothetical protein
MYVRVASKIKNEQHRKFIIENGKETNRRNEIRNLIKLSQLNRPRTQERSGVVGTIYPQGKSVIQEMNSKVVVTFRGNKVEIPLLVRDDDSSSVSVGQLRKQVVEKAAPSLESQDITLIFKGQKLIHDTQRLTDVLLADGKAPKATYRLIATGVSQTESDRVDEEYRESQRKNKILVRDDLSSQGQQKERARQQLGRKMLSQARNAASTSSNSNYGFGRIETLPNLPNEDQARGILKTLANDPGIRACMTKHKWNVGSLGELFPDGKVGQSKVCVMGLNRNKGQQILLRIRTDDLKAFRKMTSIREVLYHELAHNVHSEHDASFFQLMRQTKQECLELDWTQGDGTSSRMEIDDHHVSTISSNGQQISGGTYKLGGNVAESSRASTRELAARAALLRLSAEEEEVRQNCGCGHEHASFLPFSDQTEIDEDS